MSELPRIAPTGSTVGVRPLKPIRKSDAEPKRPDRGKTRRKGRDESDEDADEMPPEDGEPGRGSSINLRV
jgi:hypothetical protein